MRRNKSWKKWGRKADLRNTLEYAYFFNLLKNIAISRFQYDNVPFYIDTVKLETYLFEEGRAILYRDNETGYFASLGFAPDGGTWDIYGYPYGRRAVSKNSYQKAGLTPENSVLIYNNNTFTNSASIVEFHAYKLARLSISKENNLNTLKNPFIVKCKENERLTMINIMDQIYNDEPIILTNKNIGFEDSIQVLNLNTPIYFNLIDDSFTKQWQQALNALGVGYAPTYKKERTISGELTLNMEDVNVIRESFLHQRKLAVDKFNEMFNYNMAVKYNNYGGDNIGKLYNDNSRNS